MRKGIWTAPLAIAAASGLLLLVGADASWPAPASRDRVARSVTSSPVARQASQGVDLALTLEVRDGRGAVIAGREVSSAGAPAMWCVVTNVGGVDAPPTTVAWAIIGPEEEHTVGFEPVVYTIDLPALPAGQRHASRLDSVTRDGEQKWISMLGKPGEGPFVDANRSNNTCIRALVLTVRR